MNKYRIMRVPKIRILLLLLAIAISTGVVAALTLDVVNGTWTNVYGADGVNPPSCLTYRYVGNEHQVRYGDANLPFDCITPADLQSGFGFLGNSNIVFDPGEPILLGTFTHYNNPIYAINTLVAAELDLEFVFSDPVASPTVSTFVLLDETDNAQVPCPYPGTIPCSDAIYAPDVSRQFTVDGTLYELESVGFIASNNGSCTYDPALIQDFYISEEGAANSACVFGFVLVSGPDISIVKTPDTQTIIAGNDANYDIVVTNSGTIDLLNVEVTDPLAPDCNVVIGNLAPAETFTYSCSSTNVTTSFSPTATVSGASSADPAFTVTDSDTVNVTVQVPEVAITIDPPTQTLVSGNDAPFTLTVTNPGDVPLSNVVVTTDFCDATPTYLSGDSNNDNLLDLTESWIYECTTSSVTVDFTNTATVDANDPNGNPVPQDTDSADVDVINPAVNISIDPPTQQVVNGGDAPFTLTVTNPGDVPLSNVVVNTDACDASPVYASGDANNDGLLDPGETWIYDCLTAGVTVDFTNTATVDANDPNGDPVPQAVDSADVDVINPAVNITIDPPTQQVVNGGDAPFTLTVTNPGDVPLSNVVVDTTFCDATPIYVSGDVNNDGLLDVDETWIYDCLTATVTTDFTNTATVDANDPNGDPVPQDIDSADVDVINPAVAIVIDPPTQTVASGNDAPFTLTVTNEGDVPLSNVVVDTDSCSASPVYISGDANNDGLLDVSETWVYDCTTTSVTVDFTNTATVDADDPNGDPVAPDQDSADVDVINPAVAIVIDPPTQTVASGNDAPFTLTVTNLGDVPLSNVVVNTDNCDASPVYASGDANNDGLLDPGETWIYDCLTAGVTVDFTNTATVDANDPNGDPVPQAVDSADVDVINPAVNITIDPPTQQIVSGNDAPFTLTVTNPGDVPLNNVVVTTDACDASPVYLSGDANNDGLLNVDETWIYDCLTAGVSVDFTNTTIVNANDPNGDPVTPDTDSADVDVINPEINITIDPPTQQVVNGNDAPFTLTVTNPGDVPLNNVVVTTDACDATPVYVSGDANNDGLLDPGETWLYDCLTAGVTVDFTNTVTVDANDPNGDPVPQDQDSADVDVINPVVNITIDPPTQQVVNGNDAPFTLTVTNPGDVPLSNVVVNTDACDATPIYVSGDANNDGLLDVDETWLYDCLTAGVTVDFTNTVTVDANDPNGDPVPQDQDSADVDVINPVVNITIDPPTQQVVNGNHAPFTLTVTNPGDVPLSNVVVNTDACDATPIYVSGDANNDGLLDPGETWLYDCLTAGVTVDFTNTATVDANDPNGNPVPQDQDSADVDVINPVVNITIDPPTQQIVNGNDAPFTLTMTNPGDVPLSNVVVNTDACDVTPVYVSGDANNDGLLDIDETWLYDCLTAGVSVDFTNTAIVDADDPNGDPVTQAVDSADVDVINPEVAITIDPSIQRIVRGNDAPFTLLVTNPGDVPLSNVVVDTDSCDATPVYVSGDANNDGLLDIDETWIYDCTTTAINTGFTNTATVDANDPNGDPVPQDDDSADVIVVEIQIVIDPPTQQVVNGNDAPFTMTVTNLGEENLSNVVVTAPVCDVGPTYITGDSNGNNQLDLTESWIYECTAQAVTVDFTNIAIVDATSLAGSPAVTDDDSADVDVINPAIAIVIDPPTQQVVNGGDAPFTLTVTNPGDVPLSNVVVNTNSCDASPVYLSGDANNDGLLNVDETWIYDCLSAGVSVDFTNTATADANDPNGDPIPQANDSADVDVINPEVNITIDPPTQTIAIGGDAPFTLTVTNPGDVPLSNVVVNTNSCDASPVYLSGDANNDGLLDVDETWLYDCTTTVVNTGFTNTATVNADDPNGDPVPQDDDSADVIVIDVAITIDPPTQQVVNDNDANFTMTVTNPGEASLANVIVSAPVCDLGPTYISGDANNDTLLDVSESWIYECTTENVSVDFTNTATVDATAIAGNPSVSDDDSADVDVINPAVNITIDPPTQQVVNGGDASFTLTVTNPGDVPLSNVVVNTDNCDASPVYISGDTNNDGLVDVDETWLYDCLTAGVSVDFTNTATVNADDPNGDPVPQDDDSADVDVINPEVNITIDPPTQQVVNGNDAPFTLTVTNPGDVPLSNVVVNTDNCDATPAYLSGDTNNDGLLDVDETWLYDCLTAGVSVDFTNTATVNADDPNGDPVPQDDDSADVDVINPEVNITIDPPTQQVVNGNDAPFTLTVTNPGDVPLSNVVVNTDNCDASPVYISGDANNDGLLDVDETWLYDCLTAGVSVDFTNTATVDADDPNGDPVPQDDDSADVDVINPAVNITIDPPTQQVVNGNDAPFTLTATNPGDVPLSNVVVNTDACDATPAYISGDSNNDGLLDVGETWIYDCLTAGVSVDFTNTTTVNADDPNGDPVPQDDDSADVDVINPAVNITIDPPTQQVVNGNDAPFTLTVTNPGDVPLSNVVVNTDACDATPAYLSGDTNNDGLLDVDETWLYDCLTAGVSVDFTNTATVDADDPNGDPVPQDDDSADVDVINPEINIMVDPPTQTVVSGEEAQFALIVTNPGDVPLSNVVVNMDNCDAVPAYLSGDANNDGLLDVNETWLYDCTTTDVTAGFTNTATADANDPNGDPIPQDQDQGVVTIVDIALSMRSDAQTVQAGSIARFTIQVSNTGEEVLSNIVVNTPVCNPTYVSGDTNNDDLLDLDEVWTYSCSVSNVSSSIAPIATVEANFNGSSTVLSVNAQARASVTVTFPPAGTPESEGVESSPEEITVVSEPQICEPYFYHTNITGDWEVHTIGGEEALSINLSNAIGSDQQDIASSMSPDNEWVAFASNRSGDWEIYIARWEDAQIRRLTNNRAGISTDPIWGPDNEIVYAKNIDGNWDLYLLNVDTGLETQLTDDLANDENPFWSHDGSRILFQSDRSGVSQIYVIDVATGEVSQLTTSEQESYDARYSPDDQFILFRSYVAETNTMAIYTMNSDGTNVELISDPEGNASNGRWSPDSTLIAYQSDLDGDLDIYVYDRITELTRHLTDNDVDDYAPLWHCGTYTLWFNSDVAEYPQIYQTSVLPIEAEPIEVETVAIQLTTTEADNYLYSLSISTATAEDPEETRTEVLVNIQPQVPIERGR